MSNLQDVFILDHEDSGIWVWVGNDVRDKERVDAIRNARGFVKKKKYKNSTPVTRVVDMAEPFEFKMLFINWQDRSDGKATGIRKQKQNCFIEDKKLFYFYSTKNARYKGNKI